MMTEDGNKPQQHRRWESFSSNDKDVTFLTSPSSRVHSRGLLAGVPGLLISFKEQQWRFSIEERGNDWWDEKKGFVQVIWTEEPSLHIHWSNSSRAATVTVASYHGGPALWYRGELKMQHLAGCWKTETSLEAAELQCRGQSHFENSLFFYIWRFFFNLIFFPPTTDWNIFLWNKTRFHPCKKFRQMN